jgi:hypothetical protein
MTIKPATSRFLLAVGLVGGALLSQGLASIVFGQAGSAGDCGLFSLEGVMKHPRLGVIFRGVVTESKPVTAEPTERNAGLDGFLVTFRVRSRVEGSGVPRNGDLSGDDVPAFNVRAWNCGFRSHGTTTQGAC